MFIDREPIIRERSSDSTSNDAGCGPLAALVLIGTLWLGVSKCTRDKQPEPPPGNTQPGTTQSETTPAETSQDELKMPARDPTGKHWR